MNLGEYLIGYAPCQRCNFWNLFICFLSFKYCSSFNFQMEQFMLANLVADSNLNCALLRILWNNLCLFFHVIHWLFQLHQGLLNYLDRTLILGNISFEPFWKKNFFTKLFIASSIFNGTLKVKTRLKAYSTPFKENEIKK